MWETVKEVLNGSNAWFILCFLLAIVVICVILSRTGMLKINAKHIQIGNDLTQRELIRRQVETSYVYIMSVYGKIITDESKSEYKDYKAKNILERIYDKVIEWIIFNHITTNQLYIKDKQESICNLVYSMDVRDEFKTPEFKERMYSWVEELIEKLVQVKEVYK